MLNESATSDMKLLHFSLKEKWYRMIESGEKHEEYREINRYWADRIMKDYPIDWRLRMAICIEAGDFSMFYGKTFGGWDAAHFTLGYPKKDDASRNMTKDIKEIVIGKGKKEWGAEEGKDYFVIRLK